MLVNNFQQWHRCLILIVSCIIIIFIHIALYQQQIDVAAAKTEPIASTNHNIAHYISLIREIEANVIFTNSNSTKWNELYWSGYSPHHYQGLYSLDKTCQHAGFSYLCKPTAINPLITNRWTFRINEANLQPATLHFLQQLQAGGFYKNLHEQYQNNLLDHRSPYHKRTNAVSFGNSYLRQIMESYQCLIDNITQHQSNGIIYRYVPFMQAIDDSLPLNTNYDLIKCDGISIGHELVWNTKHNNALHLNQTLIDKIMEKQRNSSIKICSSHSLDLSFMDGSNLIFRFMNHEQNKSIFDYFLQQNAMNDSQNMDILIINEGNGPIYDVQHRLMDDLRRLNHTNKSIIFLTPWEDTGMSQSTFSVSKYLKKQRYKRKLYKMFPHLIYVDWTERFSEYPSFEKLRSSYLHMCIPGIPDHAMLALNNLINVLVKLYSLNEI